MTPQQKQAADAKAAYEATKLKIVDAVNAVKALKGFATAPQFAVIACVPGEALAEFVIAVSNKMSQMAMSEMLERQQLQKGPEGDGE